MILLGDALYFQLLTHSAVAAAQVDVLRAKEKKMDKPFFTAEDFVDATRNGFKRGDITASEAQAEMANAKVQPLIEESRRLRAENQKLQDECILLRTQCGVMKEALEFYAMSTKKPEGMLSSPSYLTRRSIEKHNDDGMIAREALAKCKEAER